MYEEMSMKQYGTIIRTRDKEISEKKDMLKKRMEELQDKHNSKKIIDMCDKIILALFKQRIKKGVYKKTKRGGYLENRDEPDEYLVNNNHIEIRRYRTSRFITWSCQDYTNRFKNSMFELVPDPDKFRQFINKLEYYMDELNKLKEYEKEVEFSVSLLQCNCISLNKYREDYFREIQEDVNTGITLVKGVRGWNSISNKYVLYKDFSFYPEDAWFINDDVYNAILIMFKQCNEWVDKEFEKIEKIEQKVMEYITQSEYLPYLISEEV